MFELHLWWISWIMWKFEPTFPVLVVQNKINYASICFKIFMWSSMIIYDVFPPFRYVSDARRPSKMAFQLLRLGNLIIAGVPGRSGWGESPPHCSPSLWLLRGIVPKWLEITIITWDTMKPSSMTNFHHVSEIYKLKCCNLHQWATIFWDDFYHCRPWISHDTAAIPNLMIPTDQYFVELYGLKPEQTK